jgi:proline iminopeptidase
VTGYLDYSGRDDVLGGGARRIPVDTPKGTFHVWVKRIGNNPRLRVLLLHGGPGSTHEYLEACDSFLPAAGVEYYYYEYALAHQQHLRALVISNMMASVPAYNAYAEQVLMPTMDQAKLAEIKALEAAGKIEEPRYMELLTEQHYVHHVLRLPPADWPDPVQRGFAHINPAIYVSMQGPSELGISADAKLAHWDRFADLASIQVPTLVIGARHDTMDRRAATGPVPVLPGRQSPGHVRRSAGLFRRSRGVLAQRGPPAVASAARRGKWIFGADRVGLRGQAEGSGERSP